MRKSRACYESLQILHQVQIRFTLQTAGREEHVNMRYYIIDFEMSQMFAEDEPHLVEDIRGADKSVPEYGFDHPYDPFPVDVYTLGMVFYKFFIKVYNVSKLTHHLMSI